jgi:hypothetical protein
MNKEKISIKVFLEFSLAMFPFWFILMIYYKELIYIFKSEALFLIMIYLLFSVINWFYGQKKLNRLFIAIPNVVLFFAVSSYFFPFEHMTFGIVPLMLFFIIIIPFTLIVYSFLFITGLLYQIFTWMPFLINFIYHNRKNLDNLKWD